METNLRTAEAIARVLGATLHQPWENNDYYEVTLGNGVRFGLKLGGYGNVGRVRITACFPMAVADKDGGMRGIQRRDFDDSGELKSVTISLTKTPEQIAKEIEKRFLKEYLLVWEKAIAYVAKMAEYWGVVGSNEEQVKKAFKEVKGVYVKYVSKDSVHLDVHMSLGQALKFADFLKRKRK